MDVNIIRGKSSVTYNSGTNAYSGVLSVGDTVYVDGGIYWMYVSNSNTASGSTVNFSSVGARSLIKNKNTTVEKGDLTASRWYTLIYDLALTSFRIIDLAIDINTLTAIYDFAVDGGSIGTKTLAYTLPGPSIVNINNIILLTETALSVSAPTTDFAMIEIGLVGRDTNLFDSVRGYNKYPYDLTNQGDGARNVAVGSFTIDDGIDGGIVDLKVNFEQIRNEFVPIDYDGSHTTRYAVAQSAAININQNPRTSYTAAAMGSGALNKTYIYAPRHTGPEQSALSISLAGSGTTTTFTAIDVGTVNAGQYKSIYVPSNTAVSVTISVAAVTAGKFKIIIPYQLIK